MALIDLVLRIQTAQESGVAGRDIAEQLRKDGADIKDVQQAFLQHRYVVAVYPFSADVQELHVSDTPLEGIAALIASQAPRALPSVVWNLPTGKDSAPADEAETE
jgi:hypothetical protein